MKNPKYLTKFIVWNYICTQRFIFLLFQSILKFKVSKFYKIPILILISCIGYIIAIININLVAFEFLCLKILFKKENYNSIFIIGLPRSGTTRLHRLIINENKIFTSLKTWEIFFAPSIFQKLFFKYVNILFLSFKIDLKKYIIKLEKLLFKKFNTIHKLGLFEAEEDGLILFHLFSCYHLSFILGSEKSYKNYNYNLNISPFIWEYYKICIDNHMFINKGKLYVSKNPFFTKSISTLKTKFKNSKFILMKRDFKSSLKSFLSLKNFLSVFFYGEKISKNRSYEIIKILQYWYNLNEDYLNTINLKFNFTDLTKNPKKIVLTVYNELNIPVTEELNKRLSLENLNSKKYVSKHVYIE